MECPIRERILSYVARVARLDRKNAPIPVTVAHKIGLSRLRCLLTRAHRAQVHDYIGGTSEKAFYTSTYEVHVGRYEILALEVCQPWSIRGVSEKRVDVIQCRTGTR